MSKVLEQLLQEIAVKPRQIRRNDDGTWDVLDLPLAEPHVFGEDVYDSERCRQIFDKTVAQYPVGKLVVGHERPNQPEQLVVGNLGNHRMSPSGRHVADWQRMEPVVLLDAVLGRLTGYSIEYTWPELDAVEGCALLGRSSPFFRFAKLAFEPTPEQLEQLKADAQARPLSAYARSKVIDPNSERRYRVATQETVMNRKFRQTMKNGKLTPEISEKNDKGEWGAWRELKDGESYESDVSTQISQLRDVADELAARQQMLEDRFNKALDGGRVKTGSDKGEEDREEQDDTDDDTGDEGKFPAGKKKQPKTDDDKDDEKPARAVLKKVEDLERSQRALERGLDQERIHAQLDQKVSRGAVIDGATRDAIVEAVMNKPKAERQKALDALTKNLRFASLKDDDGQNEGLEDLDADVGKDPGLREFIEKDCQPKLRSKAREFAREFDALAKAEPHSLAVKGGKLTYVRANVKRLAVSG